MSEHGTSAGPSHTSRQGAHPVAEQDDLFSPRRVHLPAAPARGRIIIPEAVAHATVTALRGFYGPDGRHEGIVFWAGRREALDQLIAAAVVPAAVHGTEFVHVPAQAVGRAASAARRSRLAILAQVHSHPTSRTDHSEGDDRMVLLPYEGMFSIVVASYGDGGVTSRDGAGIHQFQDDRWVKVSDADEAVVVAPSVMYP